jgi:prophage antirepressor-like protein
MLVKLPETFQSDLLNVELEIFVDNEGQYWFHGATLCDVFDLPNPTVTIQRHVDEDWRQRLAHEDRRGRNAWFVAEPGLYQLLHASKHSAAKRFQRWVHGEVLPQIRQKGFYATDETSQLWRNNLSALMDGFHALIEEQGDRDPAVLGKKKYQKLDQITVRLYDSAKALASSMGMDSDPILQAALEVRIKWLERNGIIDPDRDKPLHIQK